MSKQHKQLTYEQAYAELTSILQVLQSSDIELEELTKHLRRAKELLLFCRDQLHLTEKELETIFSEEEE